MVNWQPLNSIRQFDQLVEQSREKPVLVFAHSKKSSDSLHIQSKLEADWDIQHGMLDSYLLDVDTNSGVLNEMASFARVSPTFPQVYLLADAVTMYDEAGYLISARKIKIALKIINRTYRWMETRV
jgi:bacillithiol system protein YtxJ